MAAQAAGIKHRPIGGRRRQEGVVVGEGPGCVVGEELQHSPALGDGVDDVAERIAHHIAHKGRLERYHQARPRRPGAVGVPDVDLGVDHAADGVVEGAGKQRRVLKEPPQGFGRCHHVVALAVDAPRMVDAAVDAAVVVAGLAGEAR